MVVVTQAALLIVTHQRAVIGSVLALIAVTGVAIMISAYSIRALIGLVNAQERRAKTRRYRQRRKKRSRASVDEAVLNFGLKFSPYTTTGLRLALAARAALIVPTAIRTYQIMHVAG